MELREEIYQLRLEKAAAVRWVPNICTSVNFANFGVLSYKLELGNYESQESGLWISTIVLTLSTSHGSPKTRECSNRSIEYSTLMIK